MQNKISFILPFLFTACINSSSENSENLDLLSTNSIKTQNRHAKSDTLYYDLHQNSIIYVQSEKILLFSNSKGIYLSDTIRGLDFQEIVFEDRDINGYEDIVYKGYEDVEIEYLYCFDFDRNTFRKIEEHEQHGFPKPLYSDSNIFYTFSPDGCEWQNWESRLFQVKEYRLINLESIYFDGCTEGAEAENGVSFNLYNWNGKKFVQTICDSNRLFKEAESWSAEIGIREFWLEQSHGQKTKR